MEQEIQSQFNFYPNGSPTPTVTPTEVVYPTLMPNTLALVTLTPTFTPMPTFTAAPTATSNPSATPTATAGLEKSEPTPTPRPTATPYTLEGFQGLYTQNLDQITPLGLSEAEYRALFEARLYQERLLETITADIKPVEEQVWARHILVDDEATAKAIVERLHKGEDFTALAAKFSKDTGNKDRGGDLGWFGRGVMVTEFEKVAFLMQVGSISEPVKTTFGWHIIQVLGHQERPLTAAEYEQKRQQAFNDWLTQAREQANVKIYDYWKERVPTEPALPTALPGQ